MSRYTKYKQVCRTVLNGIDDLNKNNESHNIVLKILK